MNWLYLIPVVCVAGLAFFTPANVLLALAGVAVACFIALWLAGKMAGR